MDLWISLIVWLHVLLFVYWLGGDLGVFYTSRFRRDPGIDPETRLLVTRIARDIDMAPRTTLVLMLPSGFTLAAVRGYLSFNDVWLIAIWLFSLAWLALVWWLHLEKDQGRMQPWTRFDLQLRWAVTIALAAVSVSSFIAGQPIEQNFVALKVLIFAATIFCGIMIRVALKRHQSAIMNEVEELGATREREALLKSSPTGALKWVIAIWVLVALAAFIGIWKPYF